MSHLERKPLLPATHLQRPQGPSLQLQGGYSNPTLDPTRLAKVKAGSRGGTAGYCPSHDQVLLTLPKIRAATGTLSACTISAASLQSNTHKAVDGAGDFPGKRAGLISLFWLRVAGRACTPGHWLQLGNSPCATRSRCSCPYKSGAWSYPLQSRAVCWLFGNTTLEQKKA